MIDDRYELLGKLASGGMGSVWRARHRQLDIEVAVKFMDATLTGSPEFRGRFEREARAAARLRTRHVARVLDHGHFGELPYIVLELLDGQDLRALLQRARRLTPSETCRLVDQLALGLTAAHELGIVHRDLKPSNVFLAREDGEDIVKLLDFGVAKAVGFGGDEHRTSTGVLVGSPNFMSPEQARSERDVGPRSDLWSLAVIAYRCLTGRHPFPGEHAADVLLRICKGPIAPPSSLQPDLSATLDAFFVRALDRDPAGRFSTAAEFATALRSSLASGASAAGFDEEDDAKEAPYLAQATIELDVVAGPLDGVLSPSDTESGVRTTSAPGGTASASPPLAHDAARTAIRVESRPSLHDAAAGHAPSREASEPSNEASRRAGRRSRIALGAAVLGALALGTALVRSRGSATPATAAPVAEASVPESALVSNAASAVKPERSPESATSALWPPAPSGRGVDSGPSKSASPSPSARPAPQRSTQPKSGATLAPGPSWGF